MLCMSLSRCECCAIVDAAWCSCHWSQWERAQLSCNNERDESYYRHRAVFTFVHPSHGSESKQFSGWLAWACSKALTDCMSSAGALRADLGTGVLEGLSGSVMLHLCCCSCLSLTAATCPHAPTAAAGHAVPHPGSHGPRLSQLPPSAGAARGCQTWRAQPGCPPASCLLAGSAAAESPAESIEMMLHPCRPSQLIRRFIANGWATYEDHLQITLNFGKTPIICTVMNTYLLGGAVPAAADDHVGAARSLLRADLSCPGLPGVLPGASGSALSERITAGVRSGELRNEGWTAGSRLRLSDGMPSRQFLLLQGDPPQWQPQTPLAGLKPRSALPASRHACWKEWRLWSDGPSQLQLPWLSSGQAGCWTLSEGQYEFLLLLWKHL